MADVPPWCSPAWPASVAGTHRALVATVCRGYLRGPDVDDAIQETLLRWLRATAARRIDPVGPWLTRVARSVCLDMLRRHGAEKRRRHGAGMLLTAEDMLPDAAAGLAREAIAAKLPDALADLDADDRALIAERFLAAVPLRVIAARRSESVATVSRRAARAVSALGEALRDRGAPGEERVLAEYFADADYAASAVAAARDVPLRPTTDRRALLRQLRASLGDAAPALDLPALPPGPTMPGWTRPIRIGVIVHYGTVMAIGHRGIMIPADQQVRSTGLLADPRFDLVAIVEPRTSQHGIIEQTIRDYELDAGLIEATDAAALATLDVIHFGVNSTCSVPALRAVHHAVAEHGVGFFKDGHLSALDTSRLPPFARELMLSASPIHTFHMPGMCGTPTPVVVTRHSPLVGLAAGTELMVGGCAPAFVPVPTAEVLIRQHRVVTPAEHRLEGVGPLPIPMYLTGRVGRGRATVVTIFNFALYHRDRLPADYFPNLMAWLAEPRREAGRRCFIDVELERL